MRNLGITGHQALDRATATLVAEQLRAELEARGPVCGITSLAQGADQIFAKAVLAQGGSLTAVIPCAGYERSFADDRGRLCFRQLLGRCEAVVELPFDDPGEEAYWAAGKEVVGRSDELLAVWDGRPSRGLGGTADIVAFAEEHATPVLRIWPDGARRGGEKDG